MQKNEWSAYLETVGALLYFTDDNMKKAGRYSDRKRGEEKMKGN